MSNVVNLYNARREAKRQASYESYLDALERARSTGSLGDMATAVRAFQEYIDRQGFSIKAAQEFFDSIGHSWLGPKAAPCAELQTENANLRLELMAWRTGLNRRES